MREFIAVTDDLLYANPQLRARLVPYGVDLPCRRLAVSPLHDTPADLQTEVGHDTPAGGQAPDTQAPGTEAPRHIRAEAPGAR